MADVSKTELKQLIKAEIDKSVEKYVSDQLKKQLGNKATQDEITELVIKVMVKFYRTLYNRSSFWSKDLK